MAEVLRVEELHTHFFTREGVVKAVNGVSFSLKEDTILALVGESGAGKSITALSILGLVPYPGRVVKGKALFDGVDLLSLESDQLRQIRGKYISMVFQDPRAALNPILPIDVQVEEIILAHTDMSKKAARAKAVELLEEMGLPQPEQVLERYPFQLSGGMCQRVMLSIALALRPKILIADEPTSNLDVTLQAEILERLKHLCKQFHSSILLITHDMGIVAQMADEVAVMYAGTIVEESKVRDLFKRPTHPYTWGLFQALPRLDRVGQRLRPLRGGPPDLINMSEQCAFLPRCPKATNTCRLEPRPSLEEIEPEHRVACYNQVRYEWE
jgi:oligopeptide/dipeptide ABC transporter ATP-binding protein